MIDPVGDVIVALERLLHARRAVEVALDERDAREVAWHRATGTPKERAGHVLRALLLEKGWTEADLALVGVRPATVRRSLEHPRRLPA